MCTVHIHINEEAIRKHYPALSTKEFIPQWLQRQVDITNHNDAGRKLQVSGMRPFSTARSDKEWKY